MADFNKHIEFIIELEGGYKLTNHKHDKGGMTYTGISRRANPTWQGWAYIDAGKSPPKELVHKLYKENYWDTSRLDEVHNEGIASVILSSAVLSGEFVAEKLVQQVIGMEKIDGIIGPQTLLALNSYNTKGFLWEFMFLRQSRFMLLADRDKDYRVTFRGWIRRTLKDTWRAISEFT